MEATKEVRKSAATLTATIGAAAAVIFGSGPVLARIDLDPSEWSNWRIGWCLAGATVGVLGVVLVIGALVSAQTPIELTLASLPRDFKELVNNNPGDYLPEGCSSLDDFSQRLRSFRRAAARLPKQIAEEQDRDKKTALQAALEPTKANAKTYVDRRAELLAQAGYHASSRTLSDKKLPITLGAVLAVLGTTVYLLAISGKPADGNSGGGSAPEVATLVPLANGSSDSFLTTVGIKACFDADLNPDGILVLLHGGQGSPEEPWKVETVGGAEGCPRRSFTAIASVIQLVQDTPDEVKITFEPAPDSKSTTTEEPGN